MTAAAAAAESPRARATTRLATLDDVARIKAIVSTAYASDRNRINQSGIIQDERVTVDELRTMINHGDDPIVVAEVDGAVVGCIQVEFCCEHPELRLPDDAALIGMLAVHHEYECMGIGWMLARTAFAVAAHRGCRRAMLFLVNKRTDLQVIYENKGFVFTGETRAFTFGGKVLQDGVHFRVYERALP